MTRQPPALALSALALVPLLGPTAMTHAGPLEPPAGPILSTHKTLAQIEPRIPLSGTRTPGDGNSVFRITLSGSYYLTEDLVVGSGLSGIEIASSGVTIDLMGFEIRGVVSSTAGILSTINVDGVVIRNGSIRGTGSFGIEVRVSPGAPASNTRIEHVRISGCSTGLVGGNGVIVRDCVFEENSIGAILGTTSVVERSGFIRNLGRALETGSAANVSDSRFISNGGVGATLGSGSRLIDSLASGNGADGFVLATGSTVERSRSLNNAGSGFVINNSSTIIASEASGNSADGIVGAGDCLIVDNVVRSNGNAGVGAGISVSQPDNRIEGNVALLNQIGFRTTSPGNIFVRNVAGDSVVRNWDIVASNKCLVVLAATGAGISGNSGGADPGSSSPNANFSY